MSGCRASSSNLSTDVPVSEVDDLGDRDLVAAVAAAFEVSDEVLGERAQDAADDALLLDGQVAAVAVGHDLEPLGDDGEVGVASPAGGDALERGGDITGARTRTAGTAHRTRRTGTARARGRPRPCRRRRRR